MTMELGDNSTPSDKTPEDTQPSSKDAPDNQDGTKDDWEKRFKDTQASFTKDQQTKFDMAKMLVESDPTAVERIPDEKIKAKVLQEKWNVDSVEELKTLYPKALAPSDGKDDDDEDDEMAQLQQTVKLMQYKETKTKTNEAIAKAVEKAKDFSEQVPDLEDKIRNEMKYLSDDLSPTDRANRALSIVLWNSTSKADVYSVIQGISNIKAPSSNDDVADIEDSPLGKAFQQAWLRKVK